MGWIPGLGRCLGEGNGNPLQYSCLENPVERGASPWHCRVRHDLATKATTNPHLSGGLSLVSCDSITLSPNFLIYKMVLRAATPEGDKPNPNSLTPPETSQEPCTAQERGKSTSDAQHDFLFFFMVKKHTLKNFNWSLITLQYCIGFAIH